MINLIDGSHAVYPGTGDTRYGIDLRTHLAAMAMELLIHKLVLVPPGDSPLTRYEYVAQEATKYADTLIAELNKNKEG